MIFKRVRSKGSRQIIRVLLFRSFKLNIDNFRTKYEMEQYVDVLAPSRSKRVQPTSWPPGYPQQSGSTIRGALGKKRLHRAREQRFLHSFTQGDVLCLCCGQRYTSLGATYPPDVRTPKRLSLIHI